MIPKKSFTLIPPLLLAASPQLKFPGQPMLAVPRFEQYSVAAYVGKLSNPRIITSEERRFRTTLRQAITKGYQVVDGGTENERVGPNFAGHYVLVQWSCGLNCDEAAVINARNGRVFPLPRIPGTYDTPQGFIVPTDKGDLRAIQFRTSSRLIGIPYVRDGMTYWYSLTRGWNLIGKTRTPAN